MKSRLISASLVLVMLLTLLPAAVMAEGAADATPTITMEPQKAEYSLAAGTEVKVDVKITNNIGFVTATIPVVWDETVLTLKEIVRPEDLGLTQLTAKTGSGITGECSGWIGADIPEEGDTDGVYYLAWDNDLSEVNFGDTEATLCTMVFTVNAAQTAGTETTVSAVMDGSAVEGKTLLNIANMMSCDMTDLNETGVTTEAEPLTFVEKVVIKGDATGDELVNIIDVTYLARSVAHWAGYETVDVEIGDINNDGVVNIIDVTYLARHVAKWPGYESIS